MSSKIIPIFIAWISLLLSHSLMAQEPTWLEHRQFDLKPGMKLVYEAYSSGNIMGQRIREDYAITIRDLWLNGVTFQYALNQKVLGYEQGLQTLSSLDDCASIDPWWEPSAMDFDDRCELWISKKAFRELKGMGKAWLNVDTVMRNDTTVRWEFLAIVQYSCNVDGIPRIFRALLLKTNRGDDVVVLDDPQNPLILSIKSAYFEWKIIAINHE